MRRGDANVAKPQGTNAHPGTLDFARSAPGKPLRGGYNKKTLAHQVCHIRWTNGPFPVTGVAPSNAGVDRGPVFPSPGRSMEITILRATPDLQRLVVGNVRMRGQQK
jgi:hypothetical protein